MLKEQPWAAPRLTLSSLLNLIVRLFFPHNWGLLHGALASNLLGPDHTQNQVFMALFLRRNGCIISGDSHFLTGGDRALDLCPLLLHFCPVLGVSQPRHSSPPAFVIFLAAEFLSFVEAELSRNRTTPVALPDFPPTKNQEAA